MKIRQKLLVGGTVLALVPIGLAAALIGSRAYESARQSLQAATVQRLEAVRENKKAQVEDYVNGLLQSVQALARTTTVIEAMRGYKQAIDRVVQEVGADAKQRTAVAQYYARDFSVEFGNRNAARAPEVAGIAAQLDPVAAALQYQYVAANPYPLGMKEKLVDPTDGSAYGRVHRTYHPALEAAQKKFGYYDIFLVDPDTQRVLYTVYKELDFGSSLASGIAANTKLAEAVKAVARASNADQVYLSDYARYLPSYDDHAAFVATPVFDGGTQIGVLAVQVPIDRITATMTSRGRWAEVGLGTTGDAYLVGPDKLVRTNLRGVIEKKAEYVATERERARLSSEQIDTLDKRGSTVGIVKIDTEAEANALAGRSGASTFIDEHGREVLAAYAPVELAGLTWAVTAKQETGEVFAPVRSLRRTITAISIMLGALLAIVSFGATFYFVRRFMGPIARLQSVVAKVARGDMNARASLKTGDELESFGDAFDRLLDDRLAALAKAEAENERLNNSVIALLQAMQHLSERDLTVKAPVSEDIIGTVADSINKLTTETGRVLTDVTHVAAAVESASTKVKVQSDAVNKVAEAERQSVARMVKELQTATAAMQDVAKLAERSTKAAADATKSTDLALTTVQGTVRGMDAIRETIGEVEKRIKRLGERSQEISQIVSLINSIAERTHVLSLNAAMQAAVAGDAGRGFAVVAEEVQRLAENSRAATAQISGLVHNIQIETNDTIATVNKTIDQVVRGSELAQRSGSEMSETRETTARLVELVERIAASAAQQAKLANELRNGVSDIGRSTEHTAQHLQQQSLVTDTLVASAKRLAQAVRVFKLPALQS